MQKNAKGTYFTVLDGDDYWIDKNKLQKQIDFLDSNPDFTICGHNFYCLYEKDGKMEKSYNHKLDKRKYSFICNNFTDLLLGGAFPYMNTISLIYRKNSGQDIDLERWNNEYYTGDLIRTLLYGQKGKAKYLNEVMSVRRIHANNMYSNLSTLEKAVKHVKFFLYHKERTFDKKYNDEFDIVIARYTHEVNYLLNGSLFSKVQYNFLKGVMKIKTIILKLKRSKERS